MRNGGGCGGMGKDSRDAIYWTRLASRNKAIPSQDRRVANLRARIVLWDLDDLRRNGGEMSVARYRTAPIE